MFQQLVVPVDGSDRSFEAIPIAARMASLVDGKLEVVTVVDRLADVALARDELQRGIAELGELAVEPMQHVLAGDSIADTLAHHVESLSGATVLMSSHGHGRSAAVLGSTTDAVLRRLFGPVIVIGPRATEAPGTLSGRYVVPLDGSKRADSVLSIVAAWAVEFKGSPWLVEVVDEMPALIDVVESSYVSRRASEMRQRIEADVEFEVLHGGNPSRPIVDFAHSNGASLIFMATHGRTGLDRLRTGSVAAEVVRHASCPIVLFRPPDMQST